MKAIRILKSSLVGLVLGLLSMSAWAQVCGDGGQIVSNGGSLLCVNGSAGTRPYGSHTYDGVGAPSSGGYTKPSKPRVLPSKYGAVALDFKTGNFNSAYGEDSETNAKRNALTRCGSKNCKLIANYRNTCVAVAWGNLVKQGISRAGFGTTTSLAEQNALQVCSKQGGRNCKIMMPAECSLPQ
jgi:hypothetical protein